MEKIVIPAKTYHLYVNGKRTFIHVKKEQEEKLKKLEFCEKVLLVNEENEQEFIEQTFWFLYSFKEIERFIFLVFKWDKRDTIHAKRMRCVFEELRSTYQRGFHNIFVEKNYQKHLYCQMQAYSSFFFITEDISLPYTQLILEGSEPKKYVVIDTLKIREGPQLDKIINVYSMIPVELIGPI